MISSAPPSTGASGGLLTRWPLPVGTVRNSTPFANVKLLWKTKQTLRDKDLADRAFLAAMRLQRIEGV